MYEQLCKKVNAALRPIDHWPGQLSKNRRGSQFKADWGSTCSLARELDNLSAKTRVVQIAMRDNLFRADGFPRTDAQRMGGHDHPGVIVAFETKAGPLSFPCDTYVEWKDNIRGIALALESLRAVDRYGVTRQAEQYQGWRAIPAAGASSNGFRSKEEAARFVMAAAGMSTADSAAFFEHSEESRSSIFRRASGHLHPDAGGSHDQFVLLQQAKDLLTK